MKRSVALSSVLLATTMLHPTLAAAQQGGASEPPPEEIIVRGEFIPNQQRATSQVATFLTDTDLERAGDATAAIALTRLSGLSIVSNRFAYVRGLGERYSLALLNGSPLPSPEPLRRTVPLDLFPSGLLDGISVQKTYSANFPGDFGGGVIELNTLRRARDDYFSVSASVGVNSVAIEEDGIYVRGSDTDWTGYDDGLRKVPAALKDILASGQSLNSFDGDTREIVGESLVNSPFSVIQTSDLEPDLGFSVEGSRRIDRPNFGIGLIGAAGFDRGWTTFIKTRQQQQGGQLGDDIVSTETNYDVNTNALGSASLIWGDQSVQSTLFYTHSTTKEAQIDRGLAFNAPSPGLIWDERSGWYERDLAMLQLNGEHILGPFDFNWRASGSRSTREAPYERWLRRLVLDGVPTYAQANVNSIRFSHLEDTLVSAGFDVSYDFNLGETRDGTLTVGADHSRTLRDSDFLALRFRGGSGLPADVQTARPDFLFSPDNISPTRFVLEETTTPNDSYKAALDVDSVFAQADLELIPYVRTTLGARWEDAVESVRTFDRFGTQGATPDPIEKDYVLPSALVTWNFYEDMQLRLGYSQTIARPQFRELAASAYFDPETDRDYEGNRHLLDSKFKNYDVRYEWYMGRDAYLTLAGFYKEIARPIEETSFSPETFGTKTTFINSPSATLQGGEFEIRRYFQSPFEAQWFAERDWLLAFNYTYTKSEVEVGPDDFVLDPLSPVPNPLPASFFVTDGSPLQGSPENIVNLQTGWRSPTDEFTVLVGWVDERILQRGIVGIAQPDVIEDPGVQLDLSLRRYFELGGADLTLGVTARNLLDEQHVEYQRSDALGVTNFNTYDRGRTLSVSLSSRF